MRRHRPQPHVPTLVRPSGGAENEIAQDAALSLPPACWGLEIGREEVTDVAM